MDTCSYSEQGWSFWLDDNAGDGRGHDTLFNLASSQAHRTESSPKAYNWPVAPVRESRPIVRAHLINPCIHPSSRLTCIDCLASSGAGCGNGVWKFQGPPQPSRSTDASADASVDVIPVQYVCYPSRTSSNLTLHLTSVVICRAS